MNGAQLLQVEESTLGTRYQTTVQVYLNQAYRYVKNVFLIYLYRLRVCNLRTELTKIGKNFKNLSLISKRSMDDPIP